MKKNIISIAFVSIALSGCQSAKIASRLDSNMVAAEAKVGKAYIMTESQSGRAVTNYRNQLRVRYESARHTANSLRNYMIRTVNSPSRFDTAIAEELVNDLEADVTSLKELAANPVGGADMSTASILAAIASLNKGLEGGTAVIKNVRALKKELDGLSDESRERYVKQLEGLKWPSYTQIVSNLN